MDEDDRRVVLVSMSFFALSCRRICARLRRSNRLRSSEELLQPNEHESAFLPVRISTRLRCIVEQCKMAITTTRQPAYTPEQLVELTRYNHHVQFYLYIGVAALLAFFGGFNVLSRLLSRWSVRRYHSLHPAPRRVRRTGETSLACLPSAALAAWRKATYRRGQLVQLLGMGSSAQLVSLLRCRRRAERSRPSDPFARRQS